MILVIDPQYEYALFRGDQRMSKPNKNLEVIERAELRMADPATSIKKRLIVQWEKH